MFPLWQITLFAPQYPDGITMFIWINKISGNGDGVLQNINILNHYIGMAQIDPDSIPELQYFPYIVYGMIGLGILLFFVNRPGGFLIWSLIMVVLGTLGIYDFYLWEYEYGHNLSPDAPIKIPGMVYQPPLFGRKMLLNFEAFSYPHWGSLFLALAILFSLVAFWTGKRQRNRAGHTAIPAGSALLLLLLMTSCSSGPVAIPYGEAHCDHCQMTVVDQRFGSELVTKKGKVYMFDAIECMLPYMHENQDVDWEHVLVTDMDNPGTLIDASNAVYLRSDRIQSPMGYSLGAYSPKSDRSRESTGITYSWDELLKAFPEMKPGQKINTSMHRE